MEILEHYDLYDKFIINSYELQGLDDLYSANQKQKFLPDFIEISRKKVPRKDFQDFEFFHELYFISKDLRYCIANLYFFRPYINNPIRENGTYFKNPYDTRYLMYANLCYQLTYNFYDKIGDLLDVFFDTGLSGNVYFSRVINNFPKEYRTSEEYEWFVKINDTEINQLKSLRDEIVHEKNLETRFFHNVRNARSDTTQMIEIQKEKDAFPEKFKGILANCIVAFKTAVGLIQMLPDKRVNINIK
ncbi:MAG: hypothetical protein KKD31_15565 [Bacteroidetes bacterium]|nr:hypothetical protein [Bacteroidota bacterium]